uniref:Reverse transcriptase domain-containing protein n=1 Tax=Tanacetum cinerariifolium TaxID=118510 RepID=A0A6L2J8S4_TANCI|nr:reverse transcriptase domain-containing protein [Tanacetum cinerariifolium]
MIDNCTMAEMLRAPTEGCAEAIVVPPILAEQFELKHSLINMMTSEQFFGLEKDNPHDHVRVARWWLEKEPPRSIITWDDLVSKFINEFFPPSRTTNLLYWKKSPQDALTIIENKSKVRNSRSKPIASPVNACDINSSSEIAKLTHAVNQQTSDVTTAMTAMLKQLQLNPPPAQNSGITSKVTIQQPQATTIRNFHLNELEKIKRMNDVSLKAMQNQIEMVKNELRNEMKTSIQTSLSNQTNEIKNMMASLLQMNAASTSGSGSLPGNTVANPKGELKAITTRSGLVTDGPTVPTPPKSVNPEEDECLPDLIPTRMTLELANRTICTPDGIARDVFVPVGKFTFSADFVVVDYESDPRVPLILGRPFLRTARALIDVHGEEMILRDGDERLTLNMKHDTVSYSNHPHRDSVNLINIFNLSSEDCFEVLVSNKQSGNPTFSLHKEIVSLEVTHEIHDSKGCNFVSEEFPDIDSFNDIHPHFDDDPYSGSTTISANSLLEEFTDELALITYPPDYDDNRTCDIESDLREIEFLLYQGEDYDFKDSIAQMDLANLDDLFVDPTPEMFTDKQPPDYSFPPRFDVYPDDFLEIKSDANNFYDDLFDSKGEKIKESELLIDQLDLPCDILSEYDSFNSQDLSRDDDLPLPDNEDKVFNPEILIHEKSVKIITRVAQEKKLAISFDSLLFEDIDLPFYELLVFKDVPNSMRILPFSSEK